jgi:hypothetical protein
VNLHQLARENALLNENLASVQKRATGLHLRYRELAWEVGELLDARKDRRRHGPYWNRAARMRVRVATAIVRELLRGAP